MFILHGLKGEKYQMNVYEITYIVEGKQQELPSALADRFQKVNGWNEKEILQFAVAATSKNNIETQPRFLENEIVNLKRTLMTLKLQL